MNGSTPSLVAAEQTEQGLRPRAFVASIAVAAVAMVTLGRTYGATKGERRMSLPGDELVAGPSVVTDHAISIDAAPEDVWPWLVQMGWGRAGWYTPRWVDRTLFPANGPSSDHVDPDLQLLAVGDFVPDGPPESRCGFHVAVLEPHRVLVLHSTSHVPAAWRDRTELDWSWAFHLTPIDGATRTRFHFRSRWRTAPWWFTGAGWLAVVPADFYMSRGLLRGVRSRCETAVS